MGSIETARLQEVKAFVSVLLPAGRESFRLFFLDTSIARVDNSRALRKPRMKERPAVDFENNPLSDLAARYLEALLGARRNEASRLVLAAVESGTSVRSIYMDVFQPAQREMGRLWQTNEVSVAQEHYCTAATQLIMGQLFPQFPMASRNGKRIVVTCVEGELHEVGARMVADFFEMEGWDSYFLGANTPSPGILSAVAERGADILAVSVTIHYNVEAARKLVREVRRSPDSSRLRVMVGGRPFLVAPNLWSAVGADASARDADQAIVAAGRLVSFEQGCA
jgi:MerR family transcriptional regulator, light-induced transcriptional regulator